MTVNIAKKTDDEEPALCDEPQEMMLPRRSYDRRNNDRRYFELPARYMTETGEEFEGVMQDISMGGLRVGAAEPPPLGVKIVLYVDKIGRFEGKVVRSEKAEFAIKTVMSPTKMARLEEVMRAFFEDEAEDAEISDRRRNVKDRRAHDRRAVCIHEEMRIIDTGETFKCAIANLSLGGVEIITETDLSPGQKIVIGKVKGVVTRKTRQGFAITRVE